MLEIRARSTCFGVKHKTKQTRRRHHFSLERFSFLLLSMASLKATREAVLFAYCEEWLDNVEFLMLDELNTSENLDFPYDSYNRFNLEDIDEAECIAEFRFEKRHILRLEEVLQIPALMKCNQRSVFTGTEGLCLLLKRLAYPCRYSDLIHQFGRPVPVLGMITNKVIDYIPYLPVYKSTFYSLKICPKNRPRLIHGSEAEIKKSSGQISIIIVSHGNKHPHLHSTSYGVFSLINLSSSS